LNCNVTYAPFHIFPPHSNRFPFSSPFQMPFWPKVVPRPFLLIDIIIGFSGPYLVYAIRRTTQLPKSMTPIDDDNRSKLINGGCFCP
jgi:hypothetical protein